MQAPYPNVYYLVYKGSPPSYFAPQMRYLRSLIPVTY